MRRWRAGLAKFRDQEFAQFILDGLEQGFRIGFQRGSALIQAGRNMPCPDASVVDEYLRREMSLNRLIKLNKQEARSLGVHCSPMGMIPKKSKPGSWRLIVDLSAPEGRSVNDGIRRDMSSLSYMSVDLVASRILKLGKGTELAKVDIKQAYRLVPVHPADRRRLGVQWQNTVYVDKCLPFGLRSAPILFSAVADAIQGMVQL